ncbi:MAG: glucosamine-6-phosphate deaminase [Microbacteriaceae bacterium]|jgi:glucosamine-6-phosphate deaminase|nr:glucosamine-6-phosphate deaminase [Microbacteriaceae bacterium]
MEHLKYGQLDVSIAESATALGVAAAEDFAKTVRAALETRDEIAVILATGNSQLPFASALRERTDIEWSRISILHMDEYLGMSEDHPASFRRWMKENLVEPLKPKAFYGVLGDHEPVEEELARYTKLIKDLDPVICVMGIGENGHLAFNDPPADFETRELIHVVELDLACRMQQIGEGHFSGLDDTPTHALSLTVHALLRPADVLVLTPEARKAKAVKDSLEGPITPLVPGSILQQSPNARLYLDPDSSSLLAR